MSHVVMHLLALLGLGYLLAWVTPAEALRIIEPNRHFTNWTHVGDFYFTLNGRLEGMVDYVTEKTWLVVFEDVEWLNLRMRRRPSISTCDILSFATWKTEIAQSQQFSFFAPRFGRYHAFFVECDPRKEKTIHLVSLSSQKRRQSVQVFHRVAYRFYHAGHRLSTAYHAGGLSKISFDAHFVNDAYGTLSEFSTDEVAIFPTVSVFALVFFLITRFQLATTRMLWTNTGVSIATLLLITVASKFASLLVTWFGLVFFLLNGRELIGIHDHKWGSLMFDGVYSVGVMTLLITTSKGWMVTTPSLPMKNPWLLLLLFNIVMNMGASIVSVIKAIFPVDPNFGTTAAVLQACTHLYIFVVSYADLVNLMRKSRKYAGAKQRGRAFSAIAALLLTWASLPVIQVFLSHRVPEWGEPFLIAFVTLTMQSFCCIILVWGFRPEIIWDLHGERPLGTARTSATERKRKDYFSDSSDEADELDGLLL